MLTFWFVANYLNLVKAFPYRFQKDQHIRHPLQPNKVEIVHAGFTLHTFEHGYRHFDSFRLLILSQTVVYLELVENLKNTHKNMLSGID